MENAGFGSELESTSRALGVHKSVHKDIKDMITKVAKQTTPKVCIAVAYSISAVSSYSLQY